VTSFYVQNPSTNLQQVEENIRNNKFMTIKDKELTKNQKQRQERRKLNSQKEGTTNVAKKLRPGAGFYDSFWSEMQKGENQGGQQPEVSNTFVTEDGGL